MTEPRRFEQVGDGHYRLTHAAYGIQLDVDRLRRDRHELIGELSVRCDLAGARTIDGYLSIADWNLSSATARTQRAKLLAERSEAADLDWHSYLEELAQRALRAERAGIASRELSTFEAPVGDEDFSVNGWPLLQHHPVIAFGDGGAAKSYLALYAAGWLATNGQNVLYADWELSGADHRGRLERLFGAVVPKVHYLRCDKPLVLEADRIEREIHRLGITYWIADSVGFATGGPPEAAEHALAYFRVVRQLGIGSLHLAHINRSEQGTDKPFGSAFYHNSARATWFLQRSAEQADATKVQVGLFNKKCNLRARPPAMAFEFEFLPTSTNITRVSPAKIGEFNSHVPLWQKMVQHLKDAGRPQTIAQLAASLEAKPDAIQKAAVRSRNTFMAAPPTTDGIHRIALVEHRSA